MISEDLLAVLACPKCDSRPPLRLAGDRLVCDLCHSSYRIVNGVPHLLSEEAKPLDEPNGT